jgi:hypothetical protein
MNTADSRDDRRWMAVVRDEFGELVGSSTHERLETESNNNKDHKSAKDNTMADVRSP